MNADRVFNLAGAIVTVALVSSVLIRGSQASQVIRAIGEAFSGSLRVAMGQ